MGGRRSGHQHPAPSPLKKCMCDRIIHNKPHIMNIYVIIYVCILTVN